MPQKTLVWQWYCFIKCNVRDENQLSKFSEVRVEINKEPDKSKLLHQNLMKVSVYFDQKNSIKYLL